MNKAEEIYREHLRAIDVPKRRSLTSGCLTNLIV